MPCRRCTGVHGRDNYLIRWLVEMFSGFSVLVSVCARPPCCYLYLLHTWASTGIIGIDWVYEAPGEVHEFGLA